MLARKRLKLELCRRAWTHPCVGTRYIRVYRSMVLAWLDNRPKRTTQHQA